MIREKINVGYYDSITLLITFFFILHFLWFNVSFSIKITKQINEDDDVGEKKVRECLRHTTIRSKCEHQIHEHDSKLNLIKIKKINCNFHNSNINFFFF